MVPASIKAPPGAFFLSVGLYSPYTYTITNQHYKDKDGNSLGLLPIDHPKVVSGEYVGVLAGHVMECWMFGSR